MSRRFSTPLLFLACWSLLAVLFAMQTYSAAWYSGVRIGWRQAITIAVIAWYIRALLVPVGFWLARRMPLRRVLGNGRLARNVAAHAVVSVVVGTALQVVYALVMARLTWIPRRASFSVELPLNVLIYWTAVAAAHGVDYYNRARDRELATTQLEAALSAARLDALRSQLHPHFLFNALNGIAELVHENADAADQMLTELAELLRTILKQPSRQQVMLADELTLVERYLRLQQMRFGDRLRFTFDTEKVTQSAAVPFLLLQPLVENAILHGIAPRPEGGIVDIASRRQGNWLVLTVHDNGAGCSEPAEGVGLHGTRLRLRHSYAGEHAFRFMSSPGQGTTVEVRVPFAIAGAGEESSRA